MKIGIDAFGCNHGRSGIGSYIFSLVKNIPKTKHEFQLFGPELDKYTYTSDIDYIDLPIRNLRKNFGILKVLILL